MGRMEWSKQLVALDLVALRSSNHSGSRSRSGGARRNPLYHGPRLPLRPLLNVRHLYLNSLQILDGLSHTTQAHAHSSGHSRRSCSVHCRGSPRGFHRLY
jgi:hypothetical protein